MVVKVVVGLIRVVGLILVVGAVGLVAQTTSNQQPMERAMTKHKKGTGKPKAGILRPWLVDVPVDQLR